VVRVVVEVGPDLAKGDGGHVLILDRRWVWLFRSDARLCCKIEFLVAVEVVAV
jgi:hypothetical protein